jgi:CheY-like chemotaxis protein
MKMSGDTLHDITGIPGDILLIDDKPTNLHVLTAMLKDRGHKVRAVTTGQMGLVVARTANPELILLDIRMPEMDGYEVCRRLKDDGQLRHIRSFLSVHSTKP